MEFFVVQYKRSHSLRPVSLGHLRVNLALELASKYIIQPPDNLCRKRGSKRMASKNAIPDDPLAQYETYADIYYDITSLNDKQVGALLKAIVNGTRFQQKTGNFFLGIGRIVTELKFRTLYQLLPIPSPDQPGNGHISIRTDSGFIGRSYCEAMTDDLEKSYSGDTRAFAKDLEKLFKNNKKMAEFHFVTSEVYMLLLFEIARRQVKDSDESTKKKKRLDALPIESAIMNVVKLLKAKKCGFRDVFLKGGKYHCFSHKPAEREKAIKEIDDTVTLEEKSRGPGETDELTDQFKKSTLND